MDNAWCSIDGVISRADDARIPALDRGFLFADGVFESARTYAHRVANLDAHLARLQRSASLLRMDAAPHIDALRADIIALEERHASEPNESAFRIMLTRGDGISLTLSSTQLRRVVLARPLAQPMTAPIRAVLVDAANVSRDVGIRRAKTLSYVEQMLALDFARERGADEALLHDPEGAIHEGATSNIFALVDGEWRTPPLSLGILPGTARELVLRAGEGGGPPMKEALLFPHDLYRAREVFITSALRGVRAVAMIDGVALCDGSEGPETRNLRVAYDALLAVSGKNR